MTNYEELVYRGLIKDISSPKLIDIINNPKGKGFYLGTDPTAESLHIGHLSIFMLSKRLKDFGFKSVLLVGGATGKIGDPRPTAERTIIPEAVFNKNLEGIKNQVSTLFGCDEVVDNWDWSKDINFIDYLREYGKYFPVGYMLQKDTVRRRLEVGITYTEFSYMIMQSLDFLWLHENKDCILQIGGSDQWGNLTAGVDLIRKKEGKEAYALCIHLITTKDGAKFGKSEGNALWLDKNMTPPYDMYQYLLNSDDSVVVDYLKVFTFLSKEEIDALEVSVKTEPEKRLAGKALAYEVIKFVHGEEEAGKCEKMSEEIFSKGYSEEDMPSEEISKDLIGNINVLDLLVNINLMPSKSEARRNVESSGIKINNEAITDVNYIITEETFADKDFIIVSRGKKKHIKVTIKE